MRIRRCISLLMAVGITMMGVCGCMKTNKSACESGENIVLTERQMKILEEKGLPKDYCQLTARQQMTIADIEEMLQAVEKKYGRSFAYVGYTAEKQLESGELTAKPDDGNGTRDMFTVKRCGENAFVDTYIHVLVRNRYEQMVREMIAGVVEAGAFKLYSAVLETDIAFEDLEDASMRNRVKADNWLFLEGSSYHDADLTSISDQVVALFTEAELYGSLYVVVVHSDCFDVISEADYTDYLSDEYVIRRAFTNMIEE